jgi:dihydrofolate reductase
LSALAKIAFVVAIADNGVIGRDGQLPWRIANDMAHFKATTMGKPLIMGRKTWESLPRKPLPGRPNIVVTRDASFAAPGAEIALNIKQALSLAREHVAALKVDEISVIGGAELYNSMLPQAERIYLTEVHDLPKGDAYFHFDRKDWRVMLRERHAAGMKDSADYSFVLLERV